MTRQYQANPEVQWLVTDFAKGHDKAFESLDNAGADYDLADYWLYQTAIHLVACPNEVSPVDGKNQEIRWINLHLKFVTKCCV